MNHALVWNNAVTYFLQIGLLVGLASFLPTLLRLRLPSAKLVFWQLLLASCLLLPLVRPWRQNAISASVQVSTTITAVQPARSTPRRTLPATEIALALLCAGAAARLIWLAAGFWRLRRYHRHSRPLEPPPAWSVEADIRISDEIASPVTFGFRKPVILLPARFPELDAGLQDAILCHEVLHVRRRDWLFTLAEELVRTAFWFHPAIWWLLGEIQLAREQSVDRQVIEMTKSRDQYVDALLAIAGGPSGAAMQLDLAPAPLFLRKRHLKQRVISILKEVRMSKLRTVSTLTASLAGLAAACWLVTGTFPLSASPQTVTDAIGVTVEMNGAQLMHRSSVAYPREAIAAGVQGTVLVQVRLDGSGNVTDASVLTGPDELRKPVLQSVLNWHFTKDAANSTRQVSVSFHLPQGPQPPPITAETMQRALASRPTPGPGTVTGPAPRIGSINVIGLPDSARDELMSKLNVHVGDAFTPETHGQLMLTARQVDEHLNVSTRVSPNGEVALTISGPGSYVTGGVSGGVVGGVIGGVLGSVPSSAPPSIPGAVPVDANVQSAKLIHQPQAVYPPLAMQARVQGVVELAVGVGPDGHIVNIRVIKGQPLLIQSAVEAVRQWVYQPTLLNGKPVAVTTTVDVNFTLNQ